MNHGRFNKPVMPSACIAFFKDEKPPPWFKIQMNRTDNGSMLLMKWSEQFGGSDQANCLI